MIKTLLTLLLFLLSISNGNENWPTNDVYELMIKVKPEYLVYKHFHSSDTIMMIDSLSINKKFREMYECQLELFKTGKRLNLPFTKGIYLEFDERLEYRTFIKTLLAIGGIFNDNQLLRIGEVEVLTNFYAYYIRSTHWATRPILELNNQDNFISIIKNGRMTKVQYYQDMVLDTILKVNIDSCFDKESLGYSKINQNINVIRVTANGSVKIGQLVKMMKLLKNPYEYIFKFYQAEDNILNRKINIDSLCRENKK